MWPRLDVGPAHGHIADPNPGNDDVAVHQHSEPFDLTSEREPEVMASRAARIFYAGAGFLFLGIGIAGYVVPVLPGTVFILVSVWFFFKSNARMYHWVLNHPRFGPTVRAYRAGHGIPRRIKMLAITLMWLSIGLSVVFALDSMAVRGILVALGIIGTLFILTRPTTEDVLAQAALF
jgi:hypothetical protein